MKIPEWCSYFFLILLAMALGGCAQTVDLRASHFAVPIVADESFSGHVNVSTFSKTRVRLVENFETNPPIDGKTRINEDADASDFLLPLSNIAVDLRLALAAGAEVFANGSTLGLRWQILNHNAGANRWVAAIQGASSAFSKTSSSSGNPTTAEAASVVKSIQGGVSIGYRFSGVTPYASFIYEQHDATTNIRNQGGEFGPYLDSGYHQYASFGVTSSDVGFSYGIELSSIMITWSGGTTSHQSAGGLRLGWAW